MSPEPQSRPTSRPQRKGPGRLEDGTPRRGEGRYDEIQGEEVEGKLCGT